MPPLRVSTAQGPVTVADVAPYNNHTLVCTAGLPDEVVGLETVFEWNDDTNERLIFADDFTSITSTQIGSLATSTLTVIENGDRMYYEVSCIAEVYVVHSNGSRELITDQESDEVIPITVRGKQCYVTSTTLIQACMS